MALQIIKFGQKPVYLPKFVVSLIRSPNLTPYQARFHVPLHFNKLDLRDYLYHVYSVKAINIRSYIQRQKLSHDKPGTRIPAPRRWHRPRSQKYMTIDMEKAFVWPDDPANWDAWSKDVHDVLKTKEEEQQEAQEAGRRPRREASREELKEFKEHAEKLRRGKVAWRPTWVDMGREVEVDRDIKI